MTSSIVETDPQTGVDQPVSVIRNNFIRAKGEIEELQSGKMDITGGSFTGVVALASSTIIDLPDAPSNLGGLLLVVDVEAHPIPIYSDGINWRKFYDDSIVV